MLRPAFCLIIRNKGSNIAASTGHAADEGTDEGGTQKRAEHSLDIVKRRQQTVQHHMLLLAFIVIIILNTAQHLRKGEYANQHRDKGHTAHKIVSVHGKADCAAHTVNADSCQEQTDKTAHNTLDNTAGGNARDNAETEDSQSKIFRLGKLQRNLRQLRCQQNQADGTENTAEGAGQSGKTESTSRLPQLRRHRIAVQRRCRAGGRARRVDEDGRDGAAVDGAAVNAAEHGESRGGRHAVSEGHRQRHAHRRGQTGQSADHDADRRADKV